MPRIKFQNCKNPGCGRPTSVFEQKGVQAECSQCAARNPGSEGAILMGCTCPRIDNHYGRGVRSDSDFWITQDCPVHDRPEFLIPEDIARKLRVNIMTIYRHINNGKLSASKVGRQYRVSQEAYAEYLKRT
jgi:excisionase family DNA binding protein